MRAIRNRDPILQPRGTGPQVCLPVSLREFNKLKVRLRRILVPIDFSGASRRALAYALPLAKIFGAAVTLVHVVEPICSVVDCGYGRVTREWPDELWTRKAKGRLARFVGTLRRSGQPIGSTVRSGRAFSEIVQAADELGTDLIILATRGLANHPQESMGSTAERVARHAHCPVLVVREHEHEFVTVRRPEGQKRRRRGR